MPSVGPFFYLRGRLIFRAVPLSGARRQADKLDGPYGHDKLWDDTFPSGDYIRYPRGRVVWDCANDRAIVYIDRCVDRPEVLGKIAAAFGLTDYTVEHDDHYRCSRCVGDPFAD